MELKKQRDFAVIGIVQPGHAHGRTLGAFFYHCSCARMNTILVAMSELDDIYIQQPAFWVNLLQPGWLLLVSFLCVLIAGWFFFRAAGSWRQRRRFIRFVRERGVLNAQLANTLLKAYISSVTSCAVVNDLHGKKWEAFLLANCNMQGYMHQLDYLANSYYSKSNAVDQAKLTALVIHWIGHHKRRLSV